MPSQQQTRSAVRLAATIVRLRRLLRLVVDLRDLDPRAEMGHLRRVAAQHVQVVLLVMRWEVYDRLKLHAKALTYDTMLAIVPLLAVALSVVQGFGGFKGLGLELQDWLVENLTGAPAVKEAVAEQLGGFIANVQSGQLGAIPIIILIWSVLGLLGHIETSFNTIFGVKHERPFAVRLLIYWAILTLGPLFLGGSLAMTAALQHSGVSDIVSGFGFLSSALVRATPLVITWVAFAVLFMVVPSTKVKLGSALWAGIISGTLWSLLRFGYAIYAKNAITLQNIYGSMAAIPLFILWMYVSWLAVLFGAQLCFAFQHARTYQREDVARNASQRYRERLACRFLLEVARDFFANRPPTTLPAASDKLGAPPRALEVIAHALEQGGFLRTIQGGGLVPGRDIETITVEGVLTHLRQNVGTSLNLKEDAAELELDELFAKLDAHAQKTAGAVNYRYLAKRYANRFEETDVQAEPAVEDPEGSERRAEKVS